MQSIQRIRKNLREYSKEFEEEDRYAVDIANTAVVEKRKRVLNEWNAWLRRERELLADEYEAEGISEGYAVDAPKGGAAAEQETVVEEIVEEHEEVIG